MILLHGHQSNGWFLRSWNTLKCSILLPLAATLSPQTQLASTHCTRLKLLSSRQQAAGNCSVLTSGKPDFWVCLFFYIGPWLIHPDLTTIKQGENWYIESKRNSTNVHASNKWKKEKPTVIQQEKQRSNTWHIYIFIYVLKQTLDCKRLVRQRICRQPTL